MHEITVEFSDLAFSFEYVSSGSPFERNAYLCKETGRIYCTNEYLGDEEGLPDDIHDASRCISIPHKNDLDLGSPLMGRLCRNLPDDCQEVRTSFRRRGAYGRYKDLLQRRGALEQWNTFKAQATNTAPREWCKENGVPTVPRPRRVHLGATRLKTGDALVMGGRAGLGLKRRRDQKDNGWWTGFRASAVAWKSGYGGTRLESPSECGPRLAVIG